MASSSSSSDEVDGNYPPPTPPAAFAKANPSTWSLAMTLTSGGALGLSAAFKLPILAPAVAAVGFAWTYSCFASSEEVSTSSSSSSSSSSLVAPLVPSRVLTAKERKEKRMEGYFSGIGSSALLSSGHLGAAVSERVRRQRGLLPEGAGVLPAGGRNPLNVNLILLSAASAVYYSGMLLAEQGEEERTASSTKGR
jgi:hypothetical protein